MKLFIMGEEVELFKPEWEAAKKTILDFFNQIEKVSEKQNSKTFHFTALIAAHFLSAQLLEGISAETLTAVLQNNHRLEREYNRRLIEKKEEQNDQKTKK